MEIKKITDASFRKYGRILTDVDLTELVDTLSQTPSYDGIAYERSVQALEELAVCEELKNRYFGEMPIEVGYCNGIGHVLNAFEYHRSSEINIGGTDSVLILGMQQDITDEYTYDTALAEAYMLPKGCAVELYATTMHYAPCSYGDAQFKVAIVLPEGTNLPLTKEHATGEDRLLAAQNKWLIGHPEGGLPEGSPMGLVGVNISLK